MVNTSYILPYYSYFFVCFFFHVWNYTFTSFFIPLFSMLVSWAAVWADRSGIGHNGGARCLQRCILWWAIVWDFF